MITFDKGMVYHSTNEQFFKEMSVTRDTRAGRKGKKISCPNCKATYMVFHFSWSALECMTCETEVPKTDWVLKPEPDFFVSDTIEKLLNVAEHSWNDKDLVCVAVYGHEDKPENITSILKQNNIKKADVTKLKKLGVVTDFFDDDMAVIIKMDYTRVLNETNYTEEFLLNLG